MTLEEVYGRFIIKINKNAQTDNVQCDRGRFVEIYNEEKNKWLEWVLDKRNDDDIRYAQVLLVIDHEIKESNKKDNHQYFKLPDNYFDLSNISAEASSDCCDRVHMDLYEGKSENINLILQDENSKPSFDFREAPFLIASNGVVVYHNNEFVIDSVKLSYYKYPTEIRLLDLNDPESGFDESINILLDNKAVDRIISMCASSFELNNDNQKYQANKQRTISKV